MFCTHLVCFESKKVKVAPALHDQPISLSLSALHDEPLSLFLLCMHHKSLWTLVSLKHESESVVQLFLKVRQREFLLLCMMHQLFTFTFWYAWCTTHSLSLSAMHDAPTIHFHFLLCMMHQPFTFTPLHAPQKPSILCFTVVFGVRPIANHHCKTSIIQLDARNEKCCTQKNNSQISQGFPGANFSTFICACLFRICVALSKQKGLN